MTMLDLAIDVKVRWPNLSRNKKKYHIHLSFYSTWYDIKFARGENLTTALSFPLFAESLEAVIDVLCFAENDCPSFPLLRLALAKLVFL